MREVLFRVGDVEIKARLADTPTANKIWNALPLSATVQTWGAEIYFDTPVTSEREPNARDVVKPGEIAYWPDGNAIAIGFGPTPISKNGEIRLASPCNIWAETIDDVRVLLKIHAGENIVVVPVPTAAQ